MSYDKCFHVSIADMTKRMDVEFFQPTLVNVESLVSKKSVHTLSDYITSMNGGATPKLSDTSAYDLSSGAVPFVRVQNLSKYGVLELENCKLISKEVHLNELKRSQVHEGDLLVKITGVGRMAVASVAPKGFEGNINQHVVLIKTKSKEISEYLCCYLNLDVIESIAKRHSTGGVRPALDYTSLRNIPIVDNLDFSELHQAIRNYFETEEKCKMIETELKSYRQKLFNFRLGKEKTVCASFIQSYFEMMGTQWTPSNFLYHNISKSNERTFELSDICSLYKGKPITEHNVLNGKYEVIGGGKTSPYFSSEYNTEAGSITVSSSGAYAGYVWFHEKPIFASDCIVIRSKDETTFLTRFVFEVLKSYQQQIYSLQRGAGQPHVYMSDLLHLRIPLMSIVKQKEIIDYVNTMNFRMSMLRNNALEKYETACNHLNNDLLQ